MFVYSIVRSLLHGLVVYCLLCVDCCTSILVCVVLRGVVYSLLCVGCCYLFVICCMVSVLGCLFFVVCCLFHCLVSVV